MHCMCMCMRVRFYGMGGWRDLGRVGWIGVLAGGLRNLLSERLGGVVMLRRSCIFLYVLLFFLRGERGDLWKWKANASGGVLVGRGGWCGLGGLVVGVGLGRGLICRILGDCGIGWVGDRCVDSVDSKSVIICDFFNIDWFSNWYLDHWA
ncbi:hypothetical protein CC78DRAFT_275306 [Lojkania enalia]|uniref:Transmembrane protein n=1 Tax=Lojkania enalia TaxID=147567 RepID=A0A9P4K843_9PLEO|nr:hypothetical protein CC78DRAFT_275306 [Didymosphaeria enalia]